MEISTAISPGTIAHSGGRKMAGKSEKTEGSADFAGLLALGMTARQSVGAATAPADAPLGESLAASPLPATGKPGGKGLPVVPAAPGTMEAGHEAAGEAEETSEEAVPGDPVPRIEIVFAPVGLPATAQAAPTPERAVPQRGGVAVPSLPQPQGQIQSQPLSQPTTLPAPPPFEAATIAAR